MRHGGAASPPGHPRPKTHQERRLLLTPADRDAVDGPAQRPTPGAEWRGTVTHGRRLAMRSIAGTARSHETSRAGIRDSPHGRSAITIRATTTDSDSSR